MKKYLLLLACLWCAISSLAQDGYIVKVKLSNYKNYTPYLAYNENNDFVVDTNHTKENGWIVFRGKVKEPIVATFGIRKNPALFIAEGRGIIPGPSLHFFLTNQEVKIEGDADLVYMASVKGGKENEQWQLIRPKLDELQHQSWTALKAAYANEKSGVDPDAVGKAGQLKSLNKEKEKKLQMDFIRDNPGSLVGMYFLSELMRTSLSLEELKSAYQSLHKVNKNSVYTRAVSDKINSMEATAVGKSAISIQKKDINGKTVNLESLKGKYVLIDFWGSWCGPCRSSHPHLKELYGKYKQDGFEILGIAQEQYTKPEDNRKAWTKAIEEDGISWIQVLNNEGIAEFDAVKAYGVTAFPTKRLLDKEGKIIARYTGAGNETSKEIDEKLKELFGR